MTYKELLETMKKHPDYFWTREQRAANEEFKFQRWLENADKQVEPDNNARVRRHKN